MAEIEIKLPNLGEEIKSANVSFWHVEEGDVISENSDLLEVVTEKATFNVPSPTNGKLIKKNFGEGEEVKVGEIIAVLEAE